MESKLSPTIETDSNYYFFTMLIDRFAPLNDRWAKGLEKRFGKPFKPIYILPFKHNALFEEENYLVINQRLAELHKKLGRSDLINLVYPEDINKQFAESPLVQRLIDKLVKKQGKVFIVPFSSVWLDISRSEVVILGPDSQVAARFDDKVEHIRTFEKLGFTTNKTTIYQNFDELRQHKDYPFFLSPTFTSGGFESRAIYTPGDLEVYFAGLRPINQQRPFIAARLLEDIVHAPNTSALVSGRNQTTVICVSDQILRDNQYMGNIYPSQISPAHHERVKHMTVRAGNYLSRLGFRGLFGLDFLITASGHSYPIDLNPRRQGGYYCQAMMSDKIDLIELELGVALGERIPKFSYADFQIDYYLAHSKLTPYFPNVKILSVFCEGDPSQPFTKIGSTYKAMYYPKDHLLLMGNPGFYLTTARSGADLRARLFQQTEQTISTSYELYEG